MEEEEKRTSDATVSSERGSAPSVILSEGAEGTEVEGSQVGRGGDSSTPSSLRSDSAQNDDALRKKRLSSREKGLVGVVCATLAVAVVCAALYIASIVPASAAAKVGGEYLEEADVAEYISQYRAANSLTDDADFASALLSNNENVTTFRQDVINQLALNMLVEQKAKELGIEVADDDVAVELSSRKSALAGDDDELWQSVLESYGISEEQLKEQYRANLIQQAVLESQVDKREATDDELLSYVQDNLGGSTQKHAYRIVFTGDDASERAEQCLAELQATASSGEMGVEQFSEAAKKWSDEEGAAESGGVYAWSGASMGDEVKDILSDLEVGQYSDAETVEADDAFEIVFCDATYSFGNASTIVSVPDDVPDGLMGEIEQAAADAAWSDDCEAYLSSLLTATKITYYPVPEGAAYDVDMSLASDE